MMRYAKLLLCFVLDLVILFSVFDFARIAFHSLGMAEVDTMPLSVLCSLLTGLYLNQRHTLRNI